MNQDKRRGPPAMSAQDLRYGEPLGECRKGMLMLGVALQTYMKAPRKQCLLLAEEGGVLNHAPDKKQIFAIPAKKQINLSPG